MLYKNWKFGGSALNNYWALVLRSISGADYIRDEHEDLDQHGSYTTQPSCYSYPDSLGDQHPITTAVIV